MFEPRYHPQLNETTEILSGIRFGVLHSRSYRRRDDPKADPLHIHSYLEIIFNISSDLSFLVNNNLYPVRVGDAVVSRPGDVHMAIFHKSAVQEYVCLWIDADLRSPVFDFLRKEDFCSFFSFDDETKKKLTELVLQLGEMTEGGGSELEKTACLLQILTVFEQGREKQTEEADIPKALQDVLDDIHRNFSSIQSVNEILDTHFISSATLTRWFRRYIHSSPREYLEAVRLSNAATMLLGGASVTEASVCSGFSDCSHFIVLFKKKFGVTPLKYKKDRVL